MVPQPLRSRNPVLLAVCALIVGVYVLVALFVPAGTAQATFGDVLLCLLPLAANAGLLSNADTPYRRTNTFWILLAASCGMWLVGQLSWTYFELVRQALPRYSYVEEFGFFFHPIPLMAAIALQPHSRGMKETLRFGLLDFGLLAAMWLYLYAFVVLPWVSASPNDQLLMERGWQTYAGENIVYVCGLVYVFLKTHGSWRRIYGQLLGIAAIHTFGFVLAGWGSLKGVQTSGTIYELPYVLTFLWFGMLGVTARQMPLAPDPRETAEGKSSPWPHRFAIAGVLYVPILAAWNLYWSNAPKSVRDFRMVLTLGALVIGTAAVFLRQYLVDQERLSLVKSLQDSIDNLKRLQSQFVQSEKLASLGQLAAGAAHEINNPLTAILGYSDLLAEQAAAEEKTRTLAEKIREQARRTRTLVNNLLSFAREVPVEKQLLDINAVLSGATQLRTLDLRDKKIRIEMDNRGVLPAVRGDPNQLLQVFFQLISNAVDAMQDAGEGILTVRTLREHGDVVIEFSDTGPGLKDPERVFDPFYTTKPVGKGSGLGLSICYGIVQEHGGRITGFNRLEGGATFRIELPSVLALFPQATTAGSPAANTK